MSFEIGKCGIASIDFDVGLDQSTIIIRMIRPYEDTPEFYEERDGIGSIFDAYSFSSNLVEFRYGSYSERTFTNLTEPLNILRESSIIDSQRYNDMVRALAEMVEKVKIEHEQETAQFTRFLADFETNVASLYQENDLRILLRNEILFDDSINRLKYLIDEVYQYRGNPMKVGSNWVYLLLCEGALEHLIKSLNTPNYNEIKQRLETLHAGVIKFLVQYETDIHAVVERTITGDSLWLQQCYADYRSMVAAGQSPSEDRYYAAIGNVKKLNTLQLFLPSRFAK